MSITRFIKSAAILLTALTGVIGYAALAESNPSSDVETLQIEVAEDGSRFVFTSERLYEDGMPAYGTPFVTQGYIYPTGTLNGRNGVLPNGEPEFPELVIGEWTCYGWMIGDGIRTETGEWVVSTQVYKFDEQHGNAIIVTDGFELVDFNVPFTRAITGGTGLYSSASGEQMQTLLGFTDQMGVNLHVEFQVAHLEAPVETAAINSNS